MDCFEKFDPLVGHVPGYPFWELLGIASDARIFLAGKSVEDICRIEKDLDVVIYDANRSVASSIFSKYVTGIIKQHSWELRFLPEGVAISNDTVEKLLENWPVGADDQPEYQTEDEVFDVLSDLDGLRTAFDMGELGDNESEHSDPVCCASVLALMKVAECLDTMQCPEEDLGICDEGPVAARLINAANSAVEAALAIGFAKEAATYAETRAAAEEELALSLGETPKQLDVERARRTRAEISAKALEARNGPRYAARDWTWSEWQRIGQSEYQNNKSLFARDYVVPKVKVMFRSPAGTPLEVTERQVTEGWLSGPRLG